MACSIKYFGAAAMGEKLQDNNSHQPLAPFWPDIQWKRLEQYLIGLGHGKEKGRNNNLRIELLNIYLFSRLVCGFIGTEQICELVMGTSRPNAHGAPPGFRWEKIDEHGLVEAQTWQYHLIHNNQPD